MGQKDGASEIDMNSKTFAIYCSELIRLVHRCAPISSSFSVHLFLFYNHFLSFLFLVFLFSWDAAQSGASEVVRSAFPIVSIFSPSFFFVWLVEASYLSRGACFALSSLSLLWNPSSKIAFFIFFLSFSPLPSLA